MENSIKILLSYHKPDILLKDNILQPVHAGRACAKNNPNYDSQKLEWLLEHTVGDDSGDNISEKNGLYNEMTTVYWAWKNYDKLDNPDYIGFMHYRRHFLFDDKPGSIYECTDMENNYFDQINYSQKTIERLIKKYDFISVKPQKRDSMYEHYKKNHDIGDLDCAMEILKEKYPDYQESAEKYLNGQDAYFCNMFIFSKDIFFEYAQWFFDISFELEKRKDMNGKRLFISEWLTGIFITRLLEKGYKGKFFPTMMAEGEHTIPIAMATDINYFIPTIVTMTSILENRKKNTVYEFHLFISGDITENYRHRLLELEEKYGQCKVNIINMEHQYEDIKMNIAHTTSATYYRLQIASICKDVKKCIYLDSDIIVKEDLSELFRINIDDRYIAGIKAPGYYWPEKHMRKHAHEIGMEVIDQYVNAGVLLMNLEKIRTDHLEEKFSELLKKNFTSQDQDIINIACYNRIRHLPFKFNVMTKYKILTEREYDVNPGVAMCFTREEWNAGRTAPVIIHYADKIKPWNNFSVDWAEIWWEYAEKTMMYDEICSTYAKMLIKSAYEERKSLELVSAHKRDLIRHTSDLEIQLMEIKSCKAYKIGRAFLYVPYKMKRGLQCIKEHGIKYTITYGLRRILHH